MAFNTNPVRGDGSTTFFEDPLNAGTYIEIEEVLTGIEITSTRAFIDAPRLRDTGQPRKITGITDPSEGEFTLNDTQGLASTADFVALGDAFTESLNMRHVRSTNEQIDFVVNLGGVKRSPAESGQVVKITIPYTIYGTPVITEV